ncbi:Wzz/FepE/Etk N-terminal domain-containing protein [Bradyrhizobium sp. ISRA463]|uniref:Wzz/FepE/Etk N-terminal domain-containing protein n=1 Tax=Bradyrhizobium sp. ISRA463 TaxID=2866199 RepID=UPI0024789DA1|nr:Wzz/FepE/Etk N-terminal domain-containing protein [Bradyrhizobium sp. ISRA463]WGS18291.1 Wzz/FepE/Etk N-terminal domain-containing protein [Bradyrhizobium sp. ISRA463]
MLQTRITPPREIESPTQESASLEQTISAAVALIGRQYPVMIFVMCLCIGLAGVYLVTAPKRYTGTAVLLIDSRKMQGLQTQQATTADSSIDSAMVDSQVEVLKSETIATNVIKQLHLLDCLSSPARKLGCSPASRTCFPGCFRNSARPKPH